MKLLGQKEQQYQDARINLHKIYPSNKKPFLHSHPWPFSMIILKGVYEMGLVDNRDEKMLISKCVFGQGAIYEMKNKHAAHYVKPLNKKPVYNIMISALPQDRSEQSKKISDTFEPLSEYKFNELLQIFTRLAKSHQIWEHWTREFKSVQRTLKQEVKGYPPKG